MSRGETRIFGFWQGFGEGAYPPWVWLQEKTIKVNKLSKYHDELI